MLQRSEGIAAAAGAAFALTLAACGHKAPPPEAPIKKLTAQGEILQVASSWQAMEEEHGARTGQVATFKATRTSVLTLKAGTNSGEERLQIDEHFEMRDGRIFECRTQGGMRVHVRYGRRHGAPALEVIRPPATLRRDCRPADFPEIEIAIGGGSSRYQLEDERLVAFLPIDEKREYLPMQ